MHSMHCFSLLATVDLIMVLDTADDCTVLVVDIVGDAVDTIPDTVADTMMGDDIMVVVDTAVVLINTIQ